MFENLRTIPVNGLRVFEAAARLNNFAQAASELHVTPAAISQQIKKIEERLGIRLFERTGRGIRISESGKRLQSDVHDALKLLDDAVGLVIHEPSTNYLSISTVGAFAARWLVPRLDRWRIDHPATDIRVSTGGHLIDFKRDQIDFAIRIGHGRYPGLSSMQLLPEAIVPLCHPNLLRGEHPLRKPGDLANHTLIHFHPDIGDIKMDWGDWLANVGVTNIEDHGGLYFNDYSVAVNAAVTGQGVLLGLRALVGDDLRNGTLTIPFGDSLDQGLGWHIVIPNHQTNLPRINEFTDWLMSESAAIS